MKEIQYSKQKLNAKIKQHFEEIGVFEYSESKYDDSEEIQESFKLKFQDVDLYETGKYDFEITYCLDYTHVIDFEESMVYASDNSEEVKLNLKPDNSNPNKEILYEVLSDIADKQDKRDEENGYTEGCDHMDSLKGGRDYQNDLINMKS